MPIPTPRPDETQDDFLERCHSAIADEYPDPEQRHAICMDAWRSKDEMRDFVVTYLTPSDAEAVMTQFIENGICPFENARFRWLAMRVVAKLDNLSKLASRYPNLAEALLKNYHTELMEHARIHFNIPEDEWTGYTEGGRRDYFNKYKIVLAQADDQKDDADRAKQHFGISDEEWDALSDEEQQNYIDRLPPVGSGRAKHASFSWMPPIRFYPNDGRLYQVIAVGKVAYKRAPDGTVIEWTFSDDELNKSGRTLADKPINLDHTDYRIWKGQNIVLDAEPEDGKVECLCYIEDERINNLYDSSDIIGASIEFTDRDEVCTQVGDRLSCTQLGVKMRGLAFLSSKAEFVTGGPASKETAVTLIPPELIAPEAYTERHKSFLRRIKVASARASMKSIELYLRHLMQADETTPIDERVEALEGAVAWLYDVLYWMYADLMSVWEIIDAIIPLDSTTLRLEQAEDDGEDVIARRAIKKAHGFQGLALGQDAILGSDGTITQEQQDKIDAAWTLREKALKRIARGAFW